MSLVLLFLMFRFLHILFFFLSSFPSFSRSYLHFIILLIFSCLRPFDLNVSFFFLYFSFLTFSSFYSWWFFLSLYFNFLKATTISERHIQTIAFFLSRAKLSPPPTTELPIYHYSLQPFLNTSHYRARNCVNNCLHLSTLINISLLVFHSNLERTYKYGPTHPNAFVDAIFAWSIRQFHSLTTSVSLAGKFMSTPPILTWFAWRCAWMSIVLTSLGPHKYVMVAQPRRMKEQKWRKIKLNVKETILLTDNRHLRQRLK